MSADGILVAGGSGDVLPLYELDRALQPLRRVVAFALRADADAEQIRYLEVNGRRSLSSALTLHLPDSVREHVLELVGALEGFDGLPALERRARLYRIYQVLARIDATLGLPLPQRVLLPAHLTTDQALSVEPPDEKRLVSRGSPVVETEARPEAVEAREAHLFRLGDAAHTGRSLSSAGLSAAAVQALAEEGVETVADLLLLAPVSEEVLRPVHGAGRELPSGRVAVSGRVVRRVTRLRPGESRTELLLVGAGRQVLAWRGRGSASLVEPFAPGTRAVFVGDHVEGVIWDPEAAAGDGAVHLNLYGVDGLDDREIRASIRRFVPELEQLRDTLDTETRERLGLVGLGEALREVHTRGSAASEARKRLAFDEALLLQVGLATPRFQAARERGIAHGILHGLATRILLLLEVSLCDSQQVALEDVKRDLRQPMPMVRVLTGQAGAGKGLVALLSAVMVAESKSQVLVLCSDATAAELRFLFAEPLLREIGLVARLLVGEPTHAQRDALRRGEVHVVFGTIDLLDRDVEFRRLGLIIAEEREAFGRAPARVAAMRAPRPDLLVVVSPPPCAAVLLSAYGDHELSVVDGEKRPVRCETLPEARREEAYRRAAKLVLQGGQAWIAFPLVRKTTEGNGEPSAAVRAPSPWADALDLGTARQAVSAIEREMFPGRRVGLFHGEMPREERVRVYDDFVHRRLDVLVATTELEEGPPVRAASILVLEQADRVSLERLQRLRGHVSVATDPECLFVVGDPSHADGIERLERLSGEGDDFALAEWEAGRRGLDGLLAREICGPTRLRWLDPRTDRELLWLAREEAHAVLAEDPALRRGSHGDIARAIRERWEELSSAPCPLPEGSTSGPRRRRRRRKRR